MLDKYNSLNKELFNDFCLVYLDWVYTKSFDFDYCDVVIINIFSIYELTKDVEVRSRCAISAAELGRSHNRWYVMRYVVRMCDPKIDDNLAFRISMDIELDFRNKDNFNSCVRQIDLGPDSYHHLIYEAVK